MFKKITYAEFRRLIAGKWLALIGVYPHGITIREEHYAPILEYALEEALFVDLTSKGFNRTDKIGEYTYYFHEKGTEYFTMCDCKIFKVKQPNGKTFVYAIAEE